jgi:hypothetical protein
VTRLQFDMTRGKQSRRVTKVESAGRGLDKIDSSKLDAERARALELREARASENADPKAGELWTIREGILDPDTGSMIEHSWLPVVVAIWRTLGPAQEVIPISFETGIAGEGDVIADDTLYERSYMLECWLRLPVLRGALAKRIGDVPARTWARLQAACDAESGHRTGDAADDGGLSAYRQIERLRVIFASAGATAVLSQTPRAADEASIDLKRAFADRQTALIDEARSVASLRPIRPGKIPTEGLPAVVH